MERSVKPRWTTVLLTALIFVMVCNGLWPANRAEAAGQESKALRLMTFNVRNLHGDDGTINSWDNRKGIAVNAIQSFGPDIIGMQEAYDVQVNYFLSNLNASYQSIGKSRFGNTTDEYVNIMYRSDKFNVLESGQFWLSETPDVVGSRSSYDTKWPRICTWAKFQSKEDSRAIFYYFNTHYSLSADAQEQSSQLLLERISKYVTSPNVPVFIGGDLNSEEIGNGYMILDNSDFNDTWKDAGHSYVNDTTFGNYTGSTTDGHIDWIFQRNAVKINTIEINHYNENGRYPSDHYPVQLDVEIPLTGDPLPDRTSAGTATAQFNDSASGEDIAKAFDNSKTTKYCIPHGSAWIQYQFANGSKFAINRYRLTSANDNPTTRDPKSWTVKGSNDGVNWTTLDTRSNESFPLRFQTKEYTFNNSTAYEYIRMEYTSNGGAEFQLAEVELFDYVNVALNRSATADGAVTGEGPEKAFDGAVAGNSKWAATGAEPHWLRVDLGDRRNLYQFVIKHAASGGEVSSMNTVAYQIQISDDATNWTNVASVTDNRANVTTHNTNTFGRYLRLYVTDAAAKSGDTSARIYEWEAYGFASGATFYKDGSYGGNAVTLPKGNYTLAQLQEAGISNDDITSLRVFGGATVELYWDNNFQGTMLTRTEDDPSLTPEGWSDKTSSIKIY
ncbi:hypothetical protein ASG89_01665 [Paenibacillus sp. Soil766]|uniref:galactose-binding domain-containing protein n=1 Tax=Paenibacillus sp. Soil766 TaxID=1736404 RepID=UPI00070E6F61|nr:discoidin domain-containing protein [Paenibacillus sp. Soil766]KRF10265.1 hypothetical protein ASG89_01665 [Paenibacillus sp. Soil766]